MSDFCFRYAERPEFGDRFVIVFETGKFYKPIAILRKGDIKKINEEWGKRSE